MTMLKQIENKLLTAINSQHLEVINESHMHSRGTESHFKVIIVSDTFDGKRLLQRHRTINEVLVDELANHIHALSIHAYTQTEWETQQSVPPSPKCLGGSKFDK